MLVSYFPLPHTVGADIAGSWGTRWGQAGPSKSGCANRNGTTQKTEGETDGLLVIPLI